MMQFFFPINFSKPKRQEGFTLIELLVVIAIIGLLSSVVFASLNSARVKARDAKRKAELRNISVALELYYSDYGRYPPYRHSDTCGGGRDDFAISTCTDPNWLSTDPNFLTYIPFVPKDPINKPNSPPAPWPDHSPWWFANTYTYGVNTDGSKYDLLTNLENTSDPERCELKFWKSEAVWPADRGCWSDATPDTVSQLARAWQIWSVK